MDGVIFDNAEAKTKSRTCCISFDGLKRLYQLKMMHVWEYLQRKSESMKLKQEEFQKLKRQYVEAVAITRSLHHHEGNGKMLATRKEKKK